MIFEISEHHNARDSIKIEQRFADSKILDLAQDARRAGVGGRWCVL